MFAFRRILTVLLIAMLASGALSAPAWRHSHPMSEHSSPQDGAVSRSQGHPHSDHHHGDGHRHDTESDTLGEPPVEHLHVIWIGIPLTLPVSPDDSSEHSSTSGEWVPLLSEMLPPHVVVVAETLGLDSFDVGAFAVSVETPPRAELFVPPKVSLLCDTARRERSGVLKI